MNKLDQCTTARDYHNRGCNCAQSILAAFHEEMGLTLEEATRLASSFGGGMGGMRQVCGAVSGMLMALGLHQGYTDPKDKAGKAAQYEVIRALADEFKRENGSIICRELLGLDENFKPKPPEDRTDSYYKKRPCPEMVYCAADILETYLAGEAETPTA